MAIAASSLTASATKMIQISLLSVASKTGVLPFFVSRSRYCTSSEIPRSCMSCIFPAKYDFHSIVPVSHFP